MCKASRCVLTSFAMITGLLCAAPALGASTADLVSQGNRAYDAGKYDEALDAYEKASVDAPESAYIGFNEGAALYKKGEHEKAAEHFEKAALKSDSLSFEARSRFNQGNCLFRESERQRDSDLQKSLKALEQSVVHYQKALELDPTLEVAAHNIEVARITMKQLLDEIKKKQEDARAQQEKQRALAEKLKDLARRQEQLAEDVNNLEEKRKRKGDPGEVREDLAKIAEKQSDLTNETEKSAEEMDAPQNTKDHPLVKSKEHLDRAVSEQRAAERELQDENPAGAHSSQRKAAEEIHKALEAMSGEGAPEKQQGVQEQEGGVNEDGQGESSGQSRPEEQQPGEQQEKLVGRAESPHDILNEERENRERRQPRAQGGYRPVDKDW